VWTRPACGPFGGDLTGANPVDRAKRGSKLHLAVEGTGLPLSLVISAANANDSTIFAAVLDDIPMVATPAGGRRCRPAKCHADKGYDYRHCRGYLTRRGITVRIARRGIDSSQRLGRHRWKAERTIAWLDGCRRLRVRYDRSSERFFAFAMLGCARLCYNRRISANTDHRLARSPPTSTVLERPLSRHHHQAGPMRPSNRIGADLRLVLVAATAHRLVTRQVEETPLCSADAEAHGFMVRVARAGERFEGFREI
jgi:transposase